MAHILVVDDCAVDRQMVSGLLRKGTGWTVGFATDGKEALLELDRSMPDLVITDLQMPNMNGLELVTHMTKHHPSIPVMLITSEGSEEVAMQALAAGAGSYSPKRLLSDDLVTAVRALLRNAGQHKQKIRIKERMIGCRLQFSLENDTALIPPLVELLQSHLIAWDESEQLRIGVAIDEALINAMYHGNLELCSSMREDDDTRFQELARARRQMSPYQARRVEVVAEFQAGEFRISVEDEGPGYDPSSLPDPTCPENLDRVTGRGLLLIRTFMDEVDINPTGNRIEMKKKRGGNKKDPSGE